MKKNADLVVLEMTPVGPFYSPNDEAAFFEWLDKIKSIKKYYGRLETLYIEVIPSKTRETELRDLLAVFHRYKVNRKQLIVFDRKEFAPWFRNKNASWYKPIFGSNESPALAAGPAARPGERPSTPARAGARGRSLKKKKRKN